LLIFKHKTDLAEPSFVGE